MSVCNAFWWILNQIYLSIYCQPPFHFVFVAKFGADEIEKSAIEGRAATSKGETHIFKHLVDFPEMPANCLDESKQIEFSQFNLNIGRFAVFELSSLVLEVINDWSVEHVLRQRVTL